MAGLKVKETALLALLSAILLIGQIALGFLPNIEVVTLLIMVYSIVFRKKVFFIIYVFVLAEGLWFSGVFCPAFMELPSALSVRFPILR